MIYGNRDVGINYIRTRNNHTCYGMGIGIMVLDDAYPGFPGQREKEARSQAGPKSASVHQAVVA